MFPQNDFQKTSIFRLLFTGIIPFIFLSLMNVLIYHRMQVRNVVLLTKSMYYLLQHNNASSVRSKSAASKKAGSLAAVLIVIGDIQ